MIKISYGQKFIFPKDFITYTAILNEEVIIPKGTKGFVNNNNSVSILSGKNYGKEVRLGEDFEISGYDVDNISEMIIDKMIHGTYLKEFLDEYGIDKSELLDSIQDVLYEVL